MTKPIEQQIDDIENESQLPRLWERQPGETARAFAAFIRYRDLPAEDRTIRNAAVSHVERSKAKSKPKVVTVERQFEKWSAANYWGARVERYDDALLAVQYEQTAQSRRDLAVKHVDLVDKLTEKAILAVTKLDVDALTPADTVRLADAAVKLARIVHGDEPDHDPSRSPEYEAPQDTILSLLSSDPELAKAGARFGAQMLRVKREAETDDEKERER